MTGVLRWLYRQTTEKLYHEWAGVYDLVSCVVSLGNWHRWRLQALVCAGGGSVLELGFGTGHLQEAIGQSGRRGYGADASSEMVARAARRSRERGLPVRLVQARAQALPFMAGCFETVVSTFPADYIVDEETMRECARVLAAGENKASASRLAIVGLWVRTDQRLLRLVFAPFYGSPDGRFLWQMLRTLRAAGFAPAVVEQIHGAFAVGSILAVREP